MIPRFENFPILVIPKILKDLKIVQTEFHVRNNFSGLHVVTTWIRQTLTVLDLDHLHSNKLCQMDIMGNNVYNDFDYTAKLCGFSFLQSVQNTVIRCLAQILYCRPALENNTAIYSCSCGVTKLFH